MNTLCGYGGMASYVSSMSTALCLVSFPPPGGAFLAGPGLPSTPLQWAVWDGVGVTAIYSLFSVN